MEEKKTPIEAARIGREGPSLTPERLLAQKALEHQFSLGVLQAFAQLNDNVRIIPHQPDATSDRVWAVTKKIAGEQWLEVYLPEEPALDDVRQFINLVDQDTFEQKKTRGIQLLSERLKLLAGHLYREGKARSLLEQDPSLTRVVTNLFRVALALEGENSDITQEAMERQLRQWGTKEPDFDWIIWAFLGGRDTEAYQRLYRRFRARWFRSAEVRARQGKLAKHVEELEEEIVASGSLPLVEIHRGSQLGQQLADLDRQLTRTLIGPTFQEFEAYLRSKQSFFISLALEYIGGRRTREGLIRHLKRVIMADWRQAIWERGMDKVIRNIMIETPRGEKKPLLEVLNFKARRAKLEEARRQYRRGEIDLRTLARFETQWLNELHDVFDIPYDQNNRKFSGPKEMAQTNKFKCYYQTQIHGFLLVDLFPVYAVGFEKDSAPTHQSLLVEKSDGSYTLFDNSDWPIYHFSPQELKPFSVSRSLDRNPKKPEDYRLRGLVVPTHRSSVGEVEEITYFVPFCIYSLKRTDQLPFSFLKNKGDAVRYLGAISSPDVIIPKAIFGHSFEDLRTGSVWVLYENCQSNLSPVEKRSWLRCLWELDRRGVCAANIVRHIWPLIQPQERAILLREGTMRIVDGYPSRSSFQDFQFLLSQCRLLERSEKIKLFQQFPDLGSKLEQQLADWQDSQEEQEILKAMLNLWKCFIKFAR